MSLQEKQTLRWYFHLFDFVADKRLKANDLDRRTMHTHLVVVLTTGILMWGYALVAWNTIYSRVPGYVGFICSLTHLLSPLIFRFSNNKYLATNVLIGAGILHQSTYSYYTGGFESHLLIWFGILPMIGGVIDGIKAAVTWGIITTLVSVTYLILLLNGYHFPNEISPAGKLVSQAMLVFGWIFLSTSIVVVYAGLTVNYEERLNEQRQKIEDLFRVLFHDLANPLGRIAIGITIAKKSMPEGEGQRGLEIAKSASDSMLEITQNVRKMYAVSKGKANVDLSETSLLKVIEYIQKVYSADFERKQLKLHFEAEKIKNIHVLVEPVSFNNQVIGNIISNAIKFSPPGSWISVNAIPSTDGKICIEVKDNGIGIPKSLLDQLFDISKKTSRPGTSGEAGTGFGMHIVKSFVEMYGGQILVESTEKIADNPSGTTLKLILKGKLK